MNVATLIQTLPNFLLIGAMRSGSTSLHASLSSHPEVFMAQPKELHFFVEQRNWSRGVYWYARRFAHGGHAKARGEASVTYTQHPQISGVARRAASVIPRARLIYLVRDPVARMRSQYEHDFRRAIAGNPPVGWQRISRSGSAARALTAESKYLDSSRYATQLDQWLEHYSADDVCVIASEWLWQEPDAAMREIFSFLDVDPSWPVVTDQHLNTASRVRTRSRIASVPGVHHVSRMLPASVKSRLRSRPYPVPLDLQKTLEIPDDVRDLLRERLYDDVRRLRPYVRGEFTGWGIA
jgi:hypothetical protein